MNIYLISQSSNLGHDTYDSAVVCALTSKRARNMDPSNGGSSWTSYENVVVEYIGKASKNRKQTEGIILSSFNAG
jgi:hypothetical protein